MKKLEIVTSTIEDIKALSGSEADRALFMINLDQGGTTPSLELVKEVMEVATLPIHIMIRDAEKYIYDYNELKEKAEYISELEKLGVKGFAFGAKNAANRIDRCAIEFIASKKSTLHFTYNKVIDEVESIDEDIFTLGVDDVLSGNAAVIEELARLNKDKTVPGAGITVDNINDKANEYGTTWFHIGSAAREDGAISLDKIKKLKE